MSARYVEPGWFTKNVFNRIVNWLTRLGISVYGSRILAGRGRTSGEWRTTPVNMLTYEGERYLVAPHGVTQWVRNIRVSGEGELRLGRGTSRSASSNSAMPRSLPCSAHTCGAGRSRSERSSKASVPMPPTKISAGSRPTIPCSKLGVRS
jgi:hypothetical protein